LPNTVRNNIEHAAELRLRLGDFLVRGVIFTLLKNNLTPLRTGSLKYGVDSSNSVSRIVAAYPMLLTQVPNIY